MKVIIYTLVDCVKCRQLKEALTSLGVQFEERNLGDTDVMTALTMQNIVVLGASMLVVDGTIYREPHFFSGNNLNMTQLQRVVHGSKLH